MFEIGREESIELSKDIKGILLNALPSFTPAIVKVIIISLQKLNLSSKIVNKEAL